VIRPPTLEEASDDIVPRTPVYHRSYLWIDSVVSMVYTGDAMSTQP